ncbi:Uncharacterised protein [Bordetella pertussis]|nr:Uncharacterised protein [Bordetella pertussis]
MAGGQCLFVDGIARQQDAVADIGFERQPDAVADLHGIGANVACMKLFGGL